MEFPIGPLIQVGIALLGLVILISLAFGWRVARTHDHESSADGGDSERDEGHGSPR